MTEISKKARVDGFLGLPDSTGAWKHAKGVPSKQNQPDPSDREEKSEDTK